MVRPWLAGVLLLVHMMVEFTSCSAQSDTAETPWHMQMQVPTSVVEALSFLGPPWPVNHALAYSTILRMRPVSAWAQVKLARTFNLGSLVNVCCCGSNSSYVLPCNTSTVMRKTEEKNVRIMPPHLVPLAKKLHTLVTKVV